MVQKRHLRPGVLEGVRVGELYVPIVVVRRRLCGAGEGHERHGAVYASPEEWRGTLWASSPAWSGCGSTG